MASGNGKVCNQYIGHPGILVEHLRHRIDVIDGIPIPVQYTKTTPRSVIPEVAHQFIHNNYNIIQYITAKVK